jgi:hypothetical protein
MLRLVAELRQSFHDQWHALVRRQSPDVEQDKRLFKPESVA